MNSVLPRMLLLFALVSFPFVSACGDDDDGGGGTTDPTPSAQQVLSEVRVGGNVGSYVEAALPSGTATAPTVDGAAQLVRGGAMILEVTVPDGATAMYVAVEGTREGHFAVDLSGAETLFEEVRGRSGEAGLLKLRASRGAARAAAQVYNLSLSSLADAPFDSFVVDVSASVSDQFTAVASHSARFNSTAVGSQNLQVSLNWSDPVDLDLHVETPNEEDIYYGNETGMNGGSLDLDSNAACFIDGVNNENITWGEDQPVAGTYIVRVDLWSHCDEPGPFPYVVTVVVDGESTTYTGSFVPADEGAGSAFDGREITTVTIAPARR